MFWAAVLPVLKAMGMAAASQAATNVMTPDGKPGGNVFGAGLQGGMAQMQPQSTMPQQNQVLQQPLQQMMQPGAGLQMAGKALMPGYMQLLGSKGGSDIRGMAGNGFISSLLSGKLM